jgi:hypothetical protein
MFVSISCVFVDKLYPAARVERTLFKLDFMFEIHDYRS